MRLQYMQTQVDEAQAALARKHIQQQELQEKVEKSEEKLLEKQRQLYDAEKQIKTLPQVSLWLILCQSLCANTH